MPCNILWLFILDRYVYEIFFSPAQCAAFLYTVCVQIKLSKKRINECKWNNIVISNIVISISEFSGMIFGAKVSHGFRHFLEPTYLLVTRKTKKSSHLGNSTFASFMSRHWHNTGSSGAARAVERIRGHILWSHGTATCPVPRGWRRASTLSQWRHGVLEQINRSASQQPSFWTFLFLLLYFHRTSATENNRRERARGNGMRQRGM